MVSIELGLADPERREYGGYVELPAAEKRSGVELKSMRRYKDREGLMC